MPAKLDLEARMAIKVLDGQGVAGREMARLLGVTEGAVRYHLRRQSAGATDGRSRQASRLSGLEAAVDAWMDSLGERSPRNLAALHDWLITEHGFVGTLRSVQRFVRRRYPAPRQRARRRVETPPGAQAQADWGHFPGVLVGGERVDLYGFDLELSHSRFDVLVWSESRQQLAWHHVHNEAFRRIDGVPATVRVDNEKTAVSRGAGAWGEINDAYRRYAQTVRFHVDACPPRSPGHKGKVERRIRDRRGGLDPYRQAWDSVEELQVRTDEQTEQSARRRTCPDTGSSVWEAYQEEKPSLGVLPILPEPFDLVSSRKVALDCTVAFEGRSYSVPFVHIGQAVEIRGCARKVQILAGGRIVAEHPRHTAARLLLDARHYEGPSTAAVIAPPPLGRLGRKLQQIAELVPEQRPLDLYAALAEVAR